MIWTIKVPNGVQGQNLGQSLGTSPMKQHNDVGERKQGRI